MSTGTNKALQLRRRGFLAGGLLAAHGGVGCSPYEANSAEAAVASAQMDLPSRARTITPEDFGAIGNGLVDDRDAFVNATLAAVATGSILSCRPGAVYDLGRLTDQIPLVLISRADLTILGNGAEVSVNTVSAKVTTIFNFIQPERVHIDRLRVSDAGYDRANWAVPKGVCVFRVSATSVSAGGNLTLKDCTLDGGVALLICDGEAETERIRTIRFVGSNTVRNSYYGFCCQAQGDDITGILTVTNVRRAYIGYGNDGVAVHFNIHRTDEMVNGSTGCISIASSTFPGSLQTATRNIHITADCSGDLDGYTSIALFQMQSDSATASISNCSVHLRVSGAASQPSNLIAFRSYNLAGVEVTDGGAAVGLLDKISLSGDLGSAPIAFPATQATRGRLDLEHGPAVLAPASRARLLANFSLS